MTTQPSTLTTNLEPRTVVPPLTSEERSRSGLLTITDPTAFRILVLSVILGFIWDAFFYEEPLGIQMPLFVLLALAALWYTALRAPSPISARAPAAIASGAALACAAFVGLHAQEFLLLMNVATTVLMLGLVAIMLHGHSLARLTAVEAIVAGIWNGLVAVVLPLQFASSVDVAPGRATARAFVPYLRGVLLAVPVLFVFASLMASADAVFEGFLDDLLALPSLDTLVEWSARLFLISGVAWLAAAWIGSSTRATRFPLLADEEDDAALVPGLRSWVRLGVTEAATVLVLVEILFAGFVAIQLAYLFGGEQAIHADGFTYAEYARRGFFELVAVATLSLALLLTLNDLTAKPNATQRRVFRVLATLLVALVVIILVSAFQRLTLYEAAYGFTRARVIVHTFMVWLGVALLWCTWCLWTVPRRFTAGAVACAVAFVLTLDVLNPDDLIVRSNTARLVAAFEGYPHSAESAAPDWDAVGEAVRNRRNAVTDLYYLLRLSNDATPALVGALPLFEGDEHEALERELANRASRIARSGAARPGPGFHIGTWRAHQALEAAGIGPQRP